MNHAGRRESPSREARNTLWLELYQIVVRVGWIFKTETIIMPAVLDAVENSGLLRGLLPVLNRGGQSLPPLLAAGRIGRLPVKKWSLAATSLAMAACFLLLAVAWTPLSRSRPDLLAGLFLAVYAVFSTTNGLNQLVLAALQGKLIAPGNRGRALVVGVAVGSVAAILAGAAFLGTWLAEADGFAKIFAATGAFFALAALVPPWLDEPPEGAPVDTDRDPSWSSAGLRGWMAEQVALLRDDRGLVRLSLVASCFAAVLILFPHYQAFARDRIGTPIGSLLTWVLVQNAATGTASLVAGPLSDRRGTRLVLVWLVTLSSLTPLVVIWLGSLAREAAAGRFWLVYVPLGLNPISLKMFTHYALELAPRPADHARYVSLVGVALAVPFLLSPAVGLAVDAVGFRPVFLGGFVVIVAGAWLALGLPEPRHRERPPGGPDGPPSG